MHDAPRTTGTDAPKHDKEGGKVGLALVAWMLGVPGIIVLLILFFA